MAVIVEGDVGALGATAVDGLDLQALDVPGPPAPPPDETTPVLVRARAAYAGGDNEGCRGEVGKIDVAKLLAGGARSLAARAITLEAACAVQGLGVADARAAAARIAGFGLELPDTMVAPDAEKLIGDAIVAAGKAPRTPLAVAGEPGARIAIDGRAAGCAAPCTVDLPPGDHVVAVEADGFAPAYKVVRTPDTRELRVAQAPAAPELAAQQWRARVGRGLPATDPVGASLVGRLAGTPRVAFVQGGAMLTGTLVVDGVVRARGERRPGDPAALVRALAYDAGVLKRPPLWRRPSFWIAVSAATLAVSAVVVLKVYEPEVTTMVVVP